MKKDAFYRELGRDNIMGEADPNTHLAAEFYVMSMLYRYGANVALTLKEKKAIDIIVEKEGKALTIDVKGLQDKSSFPFDNCTTRKEHHYYIFVSFLEKILDPAVAPEAYIVPSLDVDQIHTELEGKDFVYRSPQDLKRVQYGRLEKLSKKYLHKWDVFCETH